MLALSGTGSLAGALPAGLERLRGYYAIVDVDVACDVASLLERAQRLLAAAPCCLQLRAKGSSAAALRDMAGPLRDACHRASVPFCINDRLDVALAVGADAVHLGQDDLPLADARRVRDAAGARNLIIGFSTHNREQALAAAAGGADYIGFGPVFDTRSKLQPDPTVGLPNLAEVCAAIRVPVVAIGGITPEAAPLVARAGARAAAVIAGVERASDPTAAGRLVGAAFS
jgi:thiamine-phosphate pyrophosphorylase